MPTDPPPSPPLDAERLVAETFIAHVERHAVIGSTQDRARQLAHQRTRHLDGAAMPLLIVADRQTAGRGRAGHRWWTGTGNLAFSLLVERPKTVHKPLPHLALAVGVAIVDAVTPELTELDLPIGLHWPNDVFVGDRKLAGVLVETLPGGVAMIGIGINTNGSPLAAPPDVRNRATLLTDLTGRHHDHTALLARVLPAIERTLYDSEPDGFGHRFDALCLQRGKQLTVQNAAQSIHGRCQGIAADGALLLETGHGTARLYSGLLVG